MNPAVRLTGIATALVLVVLVTGRPDAAPKYSDWTAPVNLGPAVNTPFIEFGPATTKDGLSLYFNAARPDGFGGPDLWVSRRSTVDDPWGPAVNLGPVVNTAANEAVPSLSRDGHWLFFNSTRPGGLGDQEGWVSWRAHTRDDFAWEPPFNLGAGVNSPFFDAGFSYLENEAGAPVLFFTSNRPGGLGAPGTFDIYVSQSLPDGSFGPAVQVPELASEANDQRPSVRFDGLEIFFFSDRPGSAAADLWVSTRTSVLSPWSSPQNLGPTVNSEFNEQQPHIAADRQTLYFASDRPDGFGGVDLYLTTRTRRHP